MNQSNFLLGQAFSPEELIGRNYIHYTDGLPDEVQPFEIICDDLSLNFSDEDDLCASDINVENGLLLLRNCIPPDCWIKRLSGIESGENGFFLVVLSQDKKHRITSINLLRENICGSNRSWISFPGTDIITVSSYDKLDYTPTAVTQELSALRSRRILPLQFTLIGKKLSSQMDENDELSFVRQSAYRQACMHMDVDTAACEENCCSIITGLEYFTCQSSGDDWGDMCSRPRCLQDTYEEAVDMLLWLIDQYTEAEYHQFLIDAKPDTFV